MAHKQAARHIGEGGSVYIGNGGWVTSGIAAEASDSALSDAHALFAQSVGGGGGTGITSGSLVYGSTSDDSTQRRVEFSLGGTAGGGDGGDVATLHSGEATTHFGDSHAVFLQSVGGGGGKVSGLGGIS